MILHVIQMLDFLRKPLAALAPTSIVEDQCRKEAACNFVCDWALLYWSAYTILKILSAFECFVPRGVLFLETMPEALAHVYPGGEYRSDLTLEMYTLCLWMLSWLLPSSMASIRQPWDVWSPVSVKIRMNFSQRLQTRRLSSIATSSRTAASDSSLSRSPRFR